MTVLSLLAGKCYRLRRTVEAKASPPTRQRVAGKGGGFEEEGGKHRVPEGRIPGTQGHDDTQLGYGERSTEQGEHGEPHGRNPSVHDRYDQLPCKESPSLAFTNQRTLRGQGFGLADS